MAFDDAADDRQPDSGPGEFLFCMKTLEDTEKFGREALIETSAAIPNPVDRLSFMLRSAYDYGRSTCVLAEFHGVSDEIDQNLAEEIPIGGSRWESGYLQRHIQIGR